MLVGDLGDSVYVGDIAVGVAQSFKVDCLCVILNCVFYFFKIVCVYKCGAYAILGKSMCKQVVAAAVDGLLCNYMLACISKRLNGIGYSGCARCCGKCRNTALKCGDSCLKNALSGVCKSAVDVACVGKSEARGSVFAVSENIRCRLIYRHRSCVGCGIGTLLSCVKLNRLKSVVVIVCIAHFKYLFLFIGGF